MPRTISSNVAPGHPDYDLLSALAHEVRRRIPAHLDAAVAERSLDALEFVLDPVRTGRTSLAQLDNVEKTFVGLKVEHFVRDLLDAPKGVRDLVLCGHDVDIKNTVGSSWCWMIPPETYREEEPCVLIACNERERRTWMGLMLAREAYLGAKNRDAKRRVLSGAFTNILWVANGVPWPRDRWAGVNMARFRELRSQSGGSARAAAFFGEHLGLPIHRRVVLSLLFDQLDPMKRLRGNQGAKDLLRPMGIALLSGTYFNPLLEGLGLPRIGTDEHIAVAPRTPEELALLKQADQLD